MLPLCRETWCTRKPTMKKPVPCVCRKPDDARRFFCGRASSVRHRVNRAILATGRPGGRKRRFRWQRQKAHAMLTTIETPCHWVFAFSPFSSSSDDLDGIGEGLLAPVFGSLVARAQRLPNGSRCVEWPLSAGSSPTADQSPGSRLETIHSSITAKPRKCLGHVSQGLKGHREKSSCRDWIACNYEKPRGEARTVAATAVARAGRIWR